MMLLLVEISMESRPVTANHNHRLIEMLLRVLICELARATTANCRSWVRLHQHCVVGGSAHVVACSIHRGETASPNDPLLVVIVRITCHLPASAVGSRHIVGEVKSHGGWTRAILKASICPRRIRVGIVCWLSEVILLVLVTMI